ncbi:MAG: mandelate racemase/muconate lactonizing enzyme family protein [Deltaproteobacteria bacterium]|nr:MAG: mandelate racemase/muconate lactonizing enzyme family protein [Deltaproteobacteria bacterium]
MKIKSIRSHVLRVPLDEPLAGGPPYFRSHNQFVILRVETEDGIEGIGATFFGGALSATLKHAVDQLGELIIGEDPLRVEAITQKLRSAAASAGPGGILTLAISGIDMALWDIKGKLLSQSLGTMLGGLRDRVPTYASGALVRAYPLDHVVKAAQLLVNRGFKQMKTQLALPGDTTPAKEVERARLIREAAGPDIDLMCDINQRWSVHQAIEIGKRVEDVHFFWLEDVTVHDDYTGLARVADALITPLAGGECLYGITPFRHMIEAHSVDIIMIDLNRVGGISNWMKVAAMAEAFNLPVVSHLFPEIHVHLVSAIPNGLTVEYMPWSFRLFEEVPVPVKGELVVPTKPGLGLQFSRDIDRYIVS